MAGVNDGMSKALTSLSIELEMKPTAVERVLLCLFFCVSFCVSGSRGERAARKDVGTFKTPAAVPLLLCRGGSASGFGVPDDQMVLCWPLDAPELGEGLCRLLHLQHGPARCRIRRKVTRGWRGVIPEGRLSG
jgi:hypothetical protein